jgi:AcrR family transcriptional regulator
MDVKGRFHRRHDPGQSENGVEMKIAALGETSAERRTPLTRDRVLEAAVDLADREGIEAVSMRKLGQELGIEAMSLYTHVRDKDDLLDGMVEVVVGRIPMRSSGSDWKAAMRQLVLAARKVMFRDPWAPRVIASRTDPGPAMMRYMETALAILRDGGFSIDLAHHAMHVLGSRVLGFNQDLYDDSDVGASGPELAALLSQEMADKFPYITELTLAISHEGGLGGCDDDVEFAFGLDLILDGLERLRA